MSQPNTTRERDLSSSVTKDAATATVDSEHDVERDWRDDDVQRESYDAAVGAGQEKALGSSKALWAWIILCFSVSRSLADNSMCTATQNDMLTLFA
jgi:hypothetical protein